MSNTSRLLPATAPAPMQLGGRGTWLHGRRQGGHWPPIGRKRLVPNRAKTGGPARAKPLAHYAENAWTTIARKLT
jgi:hypothetical protein